MEDDTFSHDNLIVCEANTNYGGTVSPAVFAMRFTLKSPLEHLDAAHVVTVKPVIPMDKTMSVQEVMDKLESEAVFVLRKAAAELENRVLSRSGSSPSRE